VVWGIVKRCVRARFRKTESDVRVRCFACIVTSINLNVFRGEYGQKWWIASCLTLFMKAEFELHF